MPDTSSTFFALAFSRKVVLSAVKMSLLVGTLLAFINHSEAFMTLNLSMDKVLKVLLTYLVPYCVSTYSAVKAIQDNERSLLTKK